jgi:hypothetical protein
MTLNADGVLKYHTHNQEQAKKWLLAQSKISKKKRSVCFDFFGHHLR